MKVVQKIKYPASCKKAFTLIELTIVIGMMVIIAGFGMGLLSQQLKLQKIIRDNNFLVEDAPQVSNMLGRIVQRADRYQIFADMTAARSGVTGASSGDVLVLVFRDAVGNKSFGMIEAQTVDGEVSINYYHEAPAAGSVPIWDEADWRLARWDAPAEGDGLVFSNTNGRLTATLKGPKNEEITYASASQL